MAGKWECEVEMIDPVLERYRVTGVHTDGDGNARRYRYEGCRTAGEEAEVIASLMEQHAAQIEKEAAAGLISGDRLASLKEDMEKWHNPQAWKQAWRTRK